MLIPSDGGAFEVKKDERLVFSKLQVGRFPEDGEVDAILTGNKDPVVS
jgi:predicted Rdx family selenoprotein